MQEEGWTVWQSVPCEDMGARNMEMAAVQPAPAKLVPYVHSENGYFADADAYDWIDKPTGNQDDDVANRFEHASLGC